MTGTAIVRQLAALAVVAALLVGCSVAVELPTDVAVVAVPTVLPELGQATDGSEPGVSAAASSGNDEPPAAMFGFPVSDEWPESFREFVDFVQETRGEEFSSVSDVRFADPKQLVAEFQSDFFTFGDLNEQDQAIVLRLDDMYRALGLADTEFNILEANRDVVGDIAAFYDWQQDEIVFPSPDGAYLEEIPIRDRPVLVHELGHALQAERRIAWSDRIEDPAMSAAMLEGEAEWLFDRYVLSLTEAEFAAWTASLPDAPEPGDLPEILQVEFASSYVLGARFFHAQYANSGLRGVAEVFTSEPAAVSAQMLLDPWLFTGDDAGQETFEYELPNSRGGGEYVELAYDFPMSAVGWHQILGAALPGDIALRAARGIDSYTLPTGWVGIDDRLCFSIEVSASSGAEGIVEGALRDWSELDGVKRWFEATDRGFYVGGCDPGPGNVPAPRATPGEILGEVAYVLDTETWAVEQGLEPRAGFCAAWDLVARIDASAEDQIDSVYYTWFDGLDINNMATDC